jgi:hypothetical protein
LKLAIGQDARLVAPDLVSHRREGTPNWRASIGTNQPQRILKAFAIALSSAQADYGLNEATADSTLGLLLLSFPQM